MNKMFIIESAEYSEYKIIEDHPNYIVFVTTLQEADTFNRNRRKYPKALLQAGLNSPYILERLRRHNWVGEAGHPIATGDEKKDKIRQMSYDHTRLSHIIRKIWWEGNLLKAEVMTADTSAGRDFMGLIRQGLAAAFSLRAQGSVVETEEGDIVGEPFAILGYDWVINPSHDKAYISSLSESTMSFHFGDTRSTYALAESATIFESGKVQPITEDVKQIEYRDFVGKNFSKYVTAKDIYVHSNGAKVIKLSEDGAIAEVQDDNVVSRVNFEDVVTKALVDEFIEIGDEDAE